jgi:hypothetical protein
MKTLVLCIAAVVTAAICYHGAKWETWFPQESARWNMFALRESGLGRMASRAMTKDANSSWHHGLIEPKQVQGSNPLSHWIDQGVLSLGFQGRLIYKPTSKFPIRPFEVREALAKTEKDLSTAFTFDPGNYEAYDAYVMFLTMQIRETEFGSMDSQKQEDDNTSEEEVDKAGSSSDDDDDFAAVQRFRKWAEEEQRRRNSRAVSVTDYAISHFAPKETDPERHLGLAMVYYNRFALLAPDIPSRKSSFMARRLFETQALQTAEKMKECLLFAQSCQQDMIASGVWQNRSQARLDDYQQVEQMVGRYIRALYETAISNLRLDGAKLWWPLLAPGVQSLASVGANKERDIRHIPCDC